MFENLTEEQLGDLLAAEGKKGEDMKLSSLPEGQIIRIVTSRKPENKTALYVHLLELVDPAKNTGRLITDAKEPKALKNGHEELIEIDPEIHHGWKMYIRTSGKNAKLIWTEHPVREIVLLDQMDSK